MRSVTSPDFISVQNHKFRAIKISHFNTLNLLYNVRTMNFKESFKIKSPTHPLPSITLIIEKKWKILKHRSKIATNISASACLLPSANTWEMSLVTFWLRSKWIRKLFERGIFTYHQTYIHTYIYMYSMKHNDYFLVVLLATDRLEYNLSVWKTCGVLSQIL